MANIIYILLTMLIFCSCDRFEFSGFFPFIDKNVDDRYEESALIDMPHDINVASNEYKLYVCGDTHYDGDISYFSDFIHIANKDSLCCVILHAGDIVEKDGNMSIFKNEFDKIYAENSYKLPLLYTVGNHDLFFEQWDEFISYFGSSTYKLNIKGVNYYDALISIDSGSGTIGKKQRKWLESQLKNHENYRYIIVLTHTNFWDTDNSQAPSGGFSVEESLLLSNLFAENDVDLVITGHDHHWDDTSFRGVRYITLDAMEINGEYAIVNCNTKGISIKAIKK